MVTCGSSYSTRESSEALVLESAHRKAPQPSNTAGQGLNPEGRAESFHHKLYLFTIWGFSGWLPPCLIWIFCLIPFAVWKWFGRSADTALPACLNKFTRILWRLTGHRWSRVEASVRTDRLCQSCRTKPVRPLTVRLATAIHTQRQVARIIWRLIRSWDVLFKARLIKSALQLHATAAHCALTCLGTSWQIFDSWMSQCWKSCFFLIYNSVMNNNVTHQRFHSQRLHCLWTSVT